jgi:hypothetical protein
MKLAILAATGAIMLSASALNAQAPAHQVQQIPQAMQNLLSMMRVPGL